MPGITIQARELIELLTAQGLRHRRRWIRAEKRYEWADFRVHTITRRIPARSGGGIEYGRAIANTHAIPTERAAAIIPALIAAGCRVSENRNRYGSLLRIELHYPGSPRAIHLISGELAIEPESPLFPEPLPAAPEPLGPDPIDGPEGQRYTDGRMLAIICRTIPDPDDRFRFLGVDVEEWADPHGSYFRSRIIRDGHVIGAGIDRAEPGESLTDRFDSIASEMGAADAGPALLRIPA